MSKNKPNPVSINLHKKSRLLTVSFDDGTTYELSCEFLRINSPSAEVQGHGPGQGVLQTGKENVNIIDIETMGNYGVKLHFDDGHNTGIYSWDYLHELGINHEQYRQDYLQALKQAGYTREIND